MEGKILQFPSHTHGALAARLNLLRTKVRETELLAVRVFGPGEAGTDGKQVRDDIILALNRLSSALWLLFCRYIKSRD
jgi:ethanolamine utilization cobalamin adenosyltransferase